MRFISRLIVCLLTVSMCFTLCHAEGKVDSRQAPNQGKLEKPSDFQLGTWMVGPTHLPKEKLDAEFKRVKKLGFNYVHWYCISFHNEKLIQQYMDLAHANGLKVLFDISKPIHEFRITRKISFEEAMRDFKKQANRWKDHPALGMWYIFDEPHKANVSADELQKFHQYLKKLTPNKKTSIALAWMADWRNYLKTADVMMPDFYPVTTKTYPNNVLKHQSEFFTRVRTAAKRPTIPIVQQFGFPNLPNMTEMRYIAFAPLLDGVTGIHFWSDWFACKEPFKKGKLDRTFNSRIVAPVLKDLKTLVKDAHPINIVQRFPNLGNFTFGTRELLAGYWKRDNKVYILVINNWPQKRKVTIPFNKVVKAGRLLPILSTRETDSEVKNSTATVEMEPWETFVWEVDLEKKADKKTETK